MPYQLTELLNRCNKDDVNFLIENIDSYINWTDDKKLRAYNEVWDGEGKIPLPLNQQLETEIRYLGSNDLAYSIRKARGITPAGVEMDEIIDDLCELTKIKVSKSASLEKRLEEFAAALVDIQFKKLSVERQKELINQMGFDTTKVKYILEKVIDHKELLIPVLIQILGRSAASEAIIALLLNIISMIVGKEAAQIIFTFIASRVPGAIGLGPIIAVAMGGWTIIDMLGPASRKTLPLVLYLGVLSFRDGVCEDFMKDA